MTQSAKRNTIKDSWPQVMTAKPHMLGLVGAGILTPDGEGTEFSEITLNCVRISQNVAAAEASSPQFCVECQYQMLKASKQLSFRVEHGGYLLRKLLVVCF